MELDVQICYKICYRFETENVFEVMLDDNFGHDPAGTEE